MPVTTKEIMTFAASLPISDELTARLVASRAYYAGYLTAANHYATPPDDTNGGTHAKLYNWLKQSTKTIDKQVGLKLQESHKIRVKADYFITQPFNSTMANANLQFATSILSLIPAAQ